MSCQTLIHKMDFPAKGLRLLVLAAFRAGYWLGLQGRRRGGPVDYNRGVARCKVDTPRRETVRLKSQSCAAKF